MRISTKRTVRRFASRAAVCTGHCAVKITHHFLRWQLVGRVQPAVLPLVVAGCTRPARLRHHLQDQVRTAHPTGR